MSAAPTNSPAAAVPARPSLPPKAFVAMGVGAILIAALVLVLVYAPVVSLLFTPTPPTVSPVGEGTIRTREREFAERLASAGNKIITRSPFHPRVEIEVLPPTPTVYGGPSVLGVAGGAVYFTDYSSGSKRIPVGETIDDVKVIKIDAPWTVTLGWKGGEYVIALLDRQPVNFDSTLTTKDTLFHATPAADATHPQPITRPR